MGFGDGFHRFDAADIEAIAGLRPGRRPGQGAHLRRAATLVHVVPGLRLRLRAGDEVVGRVGVFPPADDGPEVLSPCTFRSGVGALWQAAKAGSESPEAVNVFGAMAVDMGVPPGGAVIDPGVHQVPSCPGMVFAYASTLPAAMGAEIARDAGASIDSGQLLARTADLVCRHDPLLDTTIYAVHAPHAAAFAQARELITDIAVRCSVEELLLQL